MDETEKKQKVILLSTKHMKAYVTRAELTHTALLHSLSNLSDISNYMYM